MNSELLYITRRLGYPSSFGTRSGLGDFLEQYPDGIYAETGAGAPMGWESAAVWFGGDSERAAARFERMIAERNELSRLFRTRVSGVLVITFIYRLKSRMVTAIPIGGAQPQPVIDPTWLYFTMPEGGSVTLTKNGTPTEVTLEYSVNNGRTWTEWIETNNVRSLTLSAGQTMHVRNASETSTCFSMNFSKYYKFAFTTDTYAGGNVDSLLCKNPEDAVITDFCFCFLFNSSQTLITAPLFPSITVAPSCYRSTFYNCTALTLPANFLLPATTLYNSCYMAMFRGCVSLILPDTFILPATTLVEKCYYNMFYECLSVDKIITNMTDISSNNCLSEWLYRVSPNGDFYCSAELTIPTGISGIPGGWTRHDI